MRWRKTILLTLMCLCFSFSMMMFGGLEFGGAFREEIEIVNKTETPISVTPIGIWHGTAKRSALPVFATRIVAWPALKNGDFAIGPG
jgi:hypothetical protein